MKKTLLALAAITASTAAFAQSSVTLYGVVDVSLESVRGDKTVTRVSSDNLASSRVGFKGTEDLGGGTKANFVLETSVKPDTGANGGGTSRFWDRAAWVGLAGSFGDLRLGRMDTPLGEIAGGSILSAQAYDDLKLISGVRGGNAYRRADNAITYFLPSLVPGLTISMQYSTAIGSGSTAGTEATNGTDEGKAFGMAVKYAAGPLSAGVGYLNAKDESTAAGDQRGNATLVYAGYDFGAAKVTVYHDAETTRLAKRLTVSGAKIAVPFSPEFTLVAGLSTARNVNGSAASDDNVHITTIKGIYSLSKRTAAYAMFTNVNNDTNTLVGVVAPTILDRTTRGIAVGVRHSF